MHRPPPLRYDTMDYRRCGRSGLKLPALSLGLWHNFGANDDYANARDMVRRSFDAGITHFDLANNYGPPPGSAEATFGRILREDLSAHRDELLISTKAGYHMWPGPYGEWGSRKYLLASLDQSLQRLGLDYVDIFYSHRPDPETPLEETIGALATAVHSGKALYVGISSYDAEKTRRAAELLRAERIHLLIHQPVFNLFDRWVEHGLSDVLRSCEGHESQWKGLGFACRKLHNAALLFFDRSRVWESRRGFKPDNITVFSSCGVFPNIQIRQCLRIKLNGTSQGLIGRRKHHLRPALCVGSGCNQINLFLEARSRSLANIPVVDPFLGSCVAGHHVADRRVDSSSGVDDRVAKVDVIQHLHRPWL